MSSRFPTLVVSGLLNLCVAFALQAAPGSPAGYDVSIQPANIALTVASRTKPVEVSGQPRQTKGHPNTFWDQEDIEYFKNLLKTNKECQTLFVDLKARMDKQLLEPVNIPAPQQGSDGKWLYPGDYYPEFPGITAPDEPHTRYKRWFSFYSDVVSDMGTMYALTGDAKYADYARKILLGLAVASKTSAPPRFTMRSVIGMTSQLLEEALMMIHFARGYDLIYNLPAWTADERKQLHDEFFYPYAACCLYPGAPDYDQKGAFSTQKNNRGMIGACSVLMAGLVTDDQELINAALYGVYTEMTKPDQVKLKTFPMAKDWIAGSKDNPQRGILTTFFAPDCIPGGMWVEGTPSYAFYVMGSMVDTAEILWHHNIDLYRHNNGIFKNMFDFPILVSYPDFSTPGLNDAHRQTLFSSVTLRCYEYAYRRYQDPRYLALINNPAERDFLRWLSKQPPVALDAAPTPAPSPEPGASPPPKSQRSLVVDRIGAVPTSIFLESDPDKVVNIPPSPSVNYPLVGFGFLRTSPPGGGQQQNVILSYGPSASHGHPDKLQIDVYALGELLMPSPGVNFPYANNPRIANWYHTTVAHNTLTVDETPQTFYPPNPKRPEIRADQLVYGPAETCGVQRAFTTTAYNGVTMDRAIFMTQNYLADIFGAFSDTPHKYDLAWHVRGDPTSDLTFTPAPFSSPPVGYNTLTDVRSASAGDKSAAFTFNREGKIARLTLAAGTDTEAILGDSGFWVDSTSTDKSRRPTCPTLLQRRNELPSTIYGNALDFSGGTEPYVKNVSQEGSLEAGYALLQVATPAGTDLCFAAYRPGSHKATGLETDAMQAYAQMDGANASTLYLAGGKTLKAGNASITRSEPGLAYVEKTTDGSYILGNPSGTDATITVDLPALSGLTGFLLDANGQKGAPASVTKAGNGFSTRLAANSKIVFSK